MLPILALHFAIVSFLAPYLGIKTATLFDFAASMAAILFIIVTVLIFVFVYDNLRRGKTTNPS
jgi:uncharacterized membrane protein